MDNQPQSGSQGGQHGANSEAGAAKADPAFVFSGRGKLDDIRTVGLFIPKRLAWRLVQAVGRQLERYVPLGADDYLQKEALIELQKALKRAGYVGPA